jgi:hypothetical protein
MISVWVKSYIAPAEKNLMEQGPLSGIQSHQHCKTVSANVCSDPAKETMTYREMKYSINSRYPTRSFQLRQIISYSSASAMTHSHAHTCRSYVIVINEDLDERKRTVKQAVDTYCKSWRRDISSVDAIAVTLVGVPGLAEASPSSP